MNLRRWWLAGGAFVVAVIGALVWLSGSDGALDRGDKLASVAGALLACAGLVTSVIALVVAIRGTGASTRDPVDDLVWLVRRQWEREAAVRGLDRQEPLEVRWATTERPVAPSAAEVIGSTAADAKPIRLKLRGDTTSMADVLQRLPARQLVVIGGPGAGKTSAAILLTTSLLDQREEGDPVPVLLPLASWQPASQDLEAWIAHRLTIDHPVFRKRGTHGPEVARELVERGRVLPVLDGLDEVAPADRVDALRGIALFVGRNRPMVLTCRADTYVEIISTAGAPVGRAAVVELEPVTATAAAHYLHDGAPDGGQRWAPVVEALRDQPDGVLARALSTPLEVYLAKTAFAARDTDPANLLEFGTSAEVDQFLLEAYLPALYPGESASAARKRLTFLARRGTDLSWWRLFLRLPRPHVVVAATRGAVAGAAYFLGAFLLVAPSEVQQAEEASTARWLTTLVLFLLSGAMAGAALGALLGLTRSVSLRRFDLVDVRVAPLPRYLVLTVRQVVRRLAAGALSGVGAGVLLRTFLPSEVPLGAGLAGGAIIGAAAAGYSFAKATPVDTPLEPRHSLASERTTTIVLTLWIYGLLSAAFVVTLWSVGELGSPDSTRLFHALLVLMFLWPLSGAWVNFTVARLWFALGRKLPWRLMDFLEDAHRRGVLRQVGAAYEFRHQRLQQYFSGSDLSATPPPRADTRA